MVIGKNKRGPSFFPLQLKREAVASRRMSQILGTREAGNEGDRLPVGRAIRNVEI